MSIEVISFIFGASLLAVGCSGGGVSVKDITVPKVGIVSRVISGLSGMFLLVLSISFIESPTLRQLGNGSVNTTKCSAIDNKDTYVNLREKANGSIIRQVNNNTLVTCLDCIPDNPDAWVKVRVEDHMGGVGYMYRKLITCSD